MKSVYLQLEDSVHKKVKAYAKENGINIIQAINVLLKVAFDKSKNHASK